ncbi:MAG: hypothetical protein WAL63_04325 [Solirubrobacteraceae bacterium]
MPTLSVTTGLLRRKTTLALGATLGLGAAAALPATASASRSQIAIIQDGSDLVNAPAAMQEFRQLGANTVRVIVPWATIAPSPKSTKKPSFTATDPNAYARSKWAPYDNIVSAAKAYGLTVDFVVTGGAPRWAEGPGVPNTSTLYFAWKPNAAAYGQFFRAVATRYDGSFTPKGARSPLPAVHFWTIFNEPNFGEDLGPQAINGSTVSVAPMMYRGLLNAGWSALRATGHARDTILIGDFAARGSQHGITRHWPQGLPGNGGQTKPLAYIRTLYCVDSRYRQLRGSLAKAEGCPTSAGASRRFRSQNPALFGASGVGDHPYPGNQNPVTDGRSDPDFAAFPDLGNMERVLDRANGAYGSGKKYSIYNDEYGYITNPPNRGVVPVTGGRYVSPATAAYYINWAEYLSWKSSRIASYMQYLLQDPAPTTAIGGFASGLEFYGGRHKPGYDAYRLPVYMPHTSFSRSANEEIWGAVRPAPFMSKDGNGPQTVSIQLNNKTIKTVTVGAGGYFDINTKFPSSGSVRLAWRYPNANPFLPASDLGATVYSRSFTIKVH